MSTLSFGERVVRGAWRMTPQRALSGIIGWSARRTLPPLVRRPFLRSFARRYGIDLAEAEKPLDEYRGVQDLFTRRLRPGARPIAAGDDAVVSPADGTVVEGGVVSAGKLLEAKGTAFTLAELLADDDLARTLDGGAYLVTYLSPRDYHRVHMPFSGVLKEMIYVPGKLFSVNTLTAQQVPALFARNERVVAFFDTDAGPMAVILVGAMVVASIETVWAGLVTPPKRQLKITDYSPRPQPIRLERGAEMGRFKLGSTAIVLFGPDVVKWKDGLLEGSPTQMGEQIATLARG